ncbi:ECF transporter S component [Dictyobacter arantiisoli]|uniref:Membrane protein n=1 Tax=Dictyobacter arantiisoli TaxID=2014874 RepID=A0A5A5TAZ5_9CHLR|nr:ECF transporter S component [Dictyobacter arantiisoli]GCF08074.1 membrane protein [Dictyobacter arantiisoli]
MSNDSIETPRIRPWTLTTERIIIAGVLAAITIILGIVPNLGFIPLPNAVGNATIEHIPTIVSGIVAGPIIGIISGLIFGVLAFFRATDPFFKDPTVSIVPRLFIGLVSWAVFAGLVRINRDLAAAVAGFAGAATNTILVVSALIIRGYFPAAVIIPTVIVQAIFEAVIAAILTVILVRIFYVLEERVVHAPDKKPREQLPY